MSNRNHNYPRPGEILYPPGPASGIYVKRDNGTVTLNAWAAGTQYRYIINTSQADALSALLTSEFDGIVLVHADSEVFLSQFDPTHNQE